MEKIQLSLKSDKSNGCFTFLIIPRSVLLGSEKFQIKFVKKIRTHILYSVTFLFSHAVYEKIWENNLDLDRPQTTIQHMSVACWLPKPTNTHSEYVILIAFPLQQWLPERASMLCYMYTVCLVNLSSGGTASCSLL